jgi:hypothetical protein
VPRAATRCGRLPPPIALAPGYDPGNLNRVFTAIGALLERHRINIRQASRLLDCLGAPMRLRPAVAQVRKFANIEAGLAKTLSSLGLDTFLTVAPGAPGGIFENKQANQAPPTGVPATQASRGAPPDPSPPRAARAGGGEPGGLCMEQAA